MTNEKDLIRVSQSNRGFANPHFEDVSPPQRDESVWRGLSLTERRCAAGRVSERSRGQDAERQCLPAIESAEKRRGVVGPCCARDGATDQAMFVTNSTAKNQQSLNQLNS